MNVTVWKDAEFLRKAIESLDLFLSPDFSEILVFYPTRDKQHFLWLADVWERDVPFREIVFDEREGKGMLHFMVLTCSADLYTNSDYVIHFDSDCILRRGCDPTDWFVDGKPVVVCRRYEPLIREYPVIRTWQKSVEDSLGFTPEWETLARPGLIWPRWIYKKVRESVANHTQMPFEDYVFSCRNEFPQTFCEHNIIGAFAKRYYPDAFHWIDCDKDGWPQYPVIQFWSHGGLDRIIDNFTEFHGHTPRNVMRHILQGEPLK